MIVPGLGNLSVFPCDGEKHPLVKAWQHWAKRIEPPQHWPLVGVPTGRSFDVLDVDPDGLSWLRTAELPTTRAHRTQRGWHFLFQAAEGLRGSNDDRIATGVDVRAGGNFCVWWPREGLEVIEAVLAPWPEGLLELAMVKVKLHSDREIRETPTVGWCGERVSVGSREGRYASAALSNSFNELGAWPRVWHQKSKRWSPKRGRNTMLNKLAFKMGGLVANGWIDGALVVEVLMLGADSCELLGEDGTERCEATIMSGLRAGMQHPYPKLPELR
jgi:hypothetical protein